MRSGSSRGCPAMTPVHALVADLVDALGRGPSGLRVVEVQVLSSAWLGEPGSPGSPAVDSAHVDDRARSLPAGLPGHVLVAGRGRGRPRRGTARRPGASVHARRALPQGQPLPRRGQRPGPRHPAAAPDRREGRGRVRGDRLGRGARRDRRRTPRARSPRTAPSRCCRTTSPAPRAWCRAGSWARACSPRSAHRGWTRRSARPPRGAALRATYGGSVGIGSGDFEHARLSILWGANLLSTNLHQWRFVLAAQRRGAHVVAIDPLRTDTAERCDEHLAPRPGTDAALALGLMRVVLDEGAEDREWLGRCCEGWPELEARLGEWPVERAAEACGLPVETIVALGRRFAHTRPTAIRLGLGLQRHGGAGAAMRAILALPALTGDFRHVGGGVLCMTGAHFGGIDADRVALPCRPADARRRARSTCRASARRSRRPTTRPSPRSSSSTPTPPRAIPTTPRVHAGLAREDLFTVVLEQRLTDTARLRRHRPAGDDAARAPRPARLLRAPLRDAQPAGRRAARASACRTARSSAGWRARSGSTTRACASRDEEIVRDVLDCDAAREAGITFERLRDEGCAARRRSPVSPVRRRRLPDAERPPAAGRSRARRRTGADPLIGYVPAARARGRRARQALPARAALPRLPLRAQLDVRLAAVASRASSARRASTCIRATRTSAASRAARACASTTTAARSPRRP